MGKLILVDVPNGYQELLTVDIGSGYMQPAAVLWDEELDGAFPLVHIPNVGGLVRVAGQLLLDAAKLQAAADKKAASAAKIAARAARKLRLKTANPAAANSVPALRDIVSDLLDDNLDV